MKIPGHFSVEINRRGSGTLRHQDQRQGRRARLSQAHDEATRQAQGDRYRPAALLRRRHEGDRQRRHPGNGPLAQQSCRELTPAVSMTRTGDAAVLTNAHVAEVQFGPCLRPQPLQPRTQPHQPPGLQGLPLRCPCGMASSRELNRRRFGDSRDRWRRVPVRLTAPNYRFE